MMISALRVGTRVLLFVLCVDGTAHGDQGAQALGTIEVVGAQRAPESVDVLDAAAIAHANLLEVEQLQDEVANLRIAALGGRASQYIVSLRGFTNPYGAPESAVTLVVDGVPIDDFYSFSQRLFDVERIEVRKGPQVTGGEAGAIEIVTRKPDANARAYADASLQSRAGYDVGAGAAGALSGDAYGSFAATKDGGDGTVDNVIGHHPFNGQDGESLRGRLVWQPEERAEVDASVLGRQVDDAGGEIYLPVDRASFDALPTLAGARLGKFAQAIDHEGFNRLDSTLSALKGSWSADAVLVRALATWRTNHARNSSDYDLSPQPWFYMDSAYRVRQGHAELSAQSRDGEAGWTWNGGISGDHRDLDFLRIFHAGPGNIFELPIGDYVRTNAALSDRTYALFGESAWRLGDGRRWGLTTGLRLEDAERDVDFRANAVDPRAARLRRRDSQFLPRLTLDYRLSAHDLAYVAVARGWKPGGYNTDAFSAASTQYRPEVTTTFEVGLKGNRGDVSYAVATYRNNIRDYQDLVISEDALASYVSNARRARTQGVEATLAWRASAAWSFGAMAGTVDAVYVDDLVNADTGFRLDGQRIENVPRWNAGLHVEYTNGNWFGRTELAGAGAFVANGYSAAADTFHEQRIPGYAVVNAKFGWQGPRWSAYVFGENLGDRRYFTAAGFGFVQTALYPGAVGNVAPPRTLGVQLRRDL